MVSVVKCILFTFSCYDFRPTHDWSRLVLGGFGLYGLACIIGYGVYGCGNME